MFVFETEPNCDLENHRIHDGPRGSKAQDVKGMFVLNLDKAVQLQLETQVLGGRELVHATLVTKNGKQMPIGAQLMRLIRTLCWPADAAISHPVPPDKKDEIELHPFKVTLRNDNSETPTP
jgi:hypothetical protein